MEGDFNLRETVNKEVKEYVDASCMVLVPQYFIHTLKMGMNSIERHEQRYRRRKAKREEKKRIRNEGVTLENATSFEALHKSAKKCRKSVGWKASVQRYDRNILRNSYINSGTLKKGGSLQKGFVKFDIFERGKKRKIQSVHITERVAQKALCECIAKPIEQTLIYANGASQKGKGTHFTSNLLLRDLRDFYNHHGRNGYILLGDEHDYFGSMRHERVRELFEETLTDKDLIEYAMTYIDAFDKGLGLGSQICQISAVAYGNKIDHFIKEKLRCKYYTRYMDDWYIIHESKEELKRYLEIITQLYKDIGIEANEHKTQIVKLTHGFVFLKDRWFLREDGAVIRKPSKQNIARNRRKLKKLHKLYTENKITLEEIRCFKESVKGSYTGKHGYAITNFENLYKEKFKKEG